MREKTNSKSETEKKIEQNFATTSNFYFWKERIILSYTEYAQNNFKIISTPPNTKYAPKYEFLHIIFCPVYVPNK